MDNELLVLLQKAINPEVYDLLSNTDPDHIDVMSDPKAEYQFALHWYESRITVFIKLRGDDWEIIITPLKVMVGG